MFTPEKDIGIFLVATIITPVLTGTPTVSASGEITALLDLHVVFSSLYALGLYNK